MSQAGADHAGRLSSEKSVLALDDDNRSLLNMQITSIENKGI